MKRGYSRNIFGIPKYLIPKEGLPVASKEQMAEALSRAVFAKITSVAIYEASRSNG